MSLSFTVALELYIQGSVFSGGVYLGKNTSQPASVRASPVCECAKQAAIPSVGKAFRLCRQLERLESSTQTADKPTIKESLAEFFASQREK